MKPSKKYSSITKKLLWRKYIQEKKSIKQIAIELGCSLITVYNYLKEYNIPRRTKSEALKGKNNGKYIDGRSKTKHYCIESNCNNEISYNNWLYGSRRCKSCARKGKRHGMFGKPSAFKGKHHSEITKEKISEGNKNKVMTKEARRKMSLAAGGTGIPHENNDYPIEYTNYLRQKIRKRDNYICQLCNITEEEYLSIYNTVLDAHHIDYDKQNNLEENLICLCHKCNMKANKNRNYWFAYFTYIMEEK